MHSTNGGPPSCFSTYPWNRARVQEDRWKSTKHTKTRNVLLLSLLSLSSSNLSKSSSSWRTRKEFIAYVKHISLSLIHVFHKNQCFFEKCIKLFLLCEYIYRRCESRRKIMQRYARSVTRYPLEESPGNSFEFDRPEGLFAASSPRG